MKSNYFHRKFAIIYILSLLCSAHIKAQINDTIFIDSDFKKTNIKAFSKINGGRTLSGKGFFYFSFKNELNTVSFTIKNRNTYSESLILELTNAIVKEVKLLKLENEELINIGTTGINYPVSNKPIEHRLFAYNIDLKPQETATYYLQLRKEAGKPLVSSVYLKSDDVFNKQNSLQLTLIGLYYGISLLSVFFSFFVFYILKKYSYLIYAAYIIFLGLFISSYTGLFSQLFLNENDLFNKYSHYVLFSEISLLLFVVFSQKILEAKVYMPKLKKTIDILLVILVSIRLLIHFVFNQLFEHYISVFMNLWYALFLIMVVLIMVEIVIYYKTNFKRSSIFAIAYVFMISGVCLTILYHSYGLVNTYFYGLPFVFYSSFLEILFLTFTVILMVKDIYDERNTLSEKIVIEEKKNLTAFIKGESEERKKISRELHDNIGSKLGYLKRFVEDNIKNDAVNEAIDNICNDVRNLSHEISPSDLKLVGFKDALSGLAKKLSHQSSIQIEFHSYHFLDILDEDTELQLYRIVQEALNNVLKHANANHVDIQLMGHKNHATLSIEDDGEGFDADKEKQGLGLKNMLLRINQIGGQLEIDSQTNQGTSILITFPIKST
jgi:signal transduction histidine kinase